jgi:hypothetical protein
MNCRVTNGPINIVDKFVSVALYAYLSDSEFESITDKVAMQAHVTKSSVRRTFKAAFKKNIDARNEEEHHRRAAERLDPQPRLPVPPTDAEYLPQMRILNEVLGRSSHPEPPMRNTEDVCMRSRVRSPMNMHAFSALDANDENTEVSFNNRLPVPEQFLLTAMSKGEIAETIKRHIEFYDPYERAVHYPSVFTEHVVKRDDGAPTQCHPRAPWAGWLWSRPQGCAKALSVELRAAAIVASSQCKRTWSSPKTTIRTKSTVGRASPSTDSASSGRSTTTTRPAPIGPAIPATRT